MGRVALPYQFNRLQIEKLRAQLLVFITVDAQGDSGAGRSVRRTVMSP